MPESNLNVERSRRIRKDIQGKSALRERPTEMIVIAIVGCCADILHKPGVTLSRLWLANETTQSRYSSGIALTSSNCFISSALSGNDRYHP
jgi:hypothetical protein